MFSKNHINNIIIDIHEHNINNTYFLSRAVDNQGRQTQNTAPHHGSLAQVPYSIHMHAWTYTL